MLTRAGWNVVIVEKGRNHLLDPDDLTRPAADYSNDELKFIYRHFLGPDPLDRAADVPPVRGATASHAYVGEVNSIPTTVGGGGTHADGKVPRFREEDFRAAEHLRARRGPRWPTGRSTTTSSSPSTPRPSAAIGVAGEAGANPFAAWRSGPYPMPSGAPMYGAVLSSAAAEGQGLHPYAAPTAANSIPYDGRPACNNCGLCAFFGCPIHAKGDPVALLHAGPWRRGGPSCCPRPSCRRMVTPGRRRHRRRRHRPRRRDPDDRRPPRGRRRRRDRDAAPAAAVGDRASPRRPELHVHFQTIVVGILPERAARHQGRSVTHVHDDAMIVDDARAAAAAEAGLPWIRGGLVEHGGGGQPVMEAQFYPWGGQAQVAHAQSPLRDRMWAFTMQGEDLPQLTNRVDLDPTVRDVRGFPVARVTYRPHRHELVPRPTTGRACARARGHGRHVDHDLHLASGRAPDPAGAAPVPGAATSWGPPGWATTRRPRWWTLGRLHGLDNVVVADSSVFVTSAGYGPTLTLVALAARAAHHLAGTKPA